MLHTRYPESPYAAALHDATRNERPLPERLTTLWTVLLLYADVCVTLAAAFAAGVPATAGPAACVVICGSFALCGVYQRSFAVHARDEAYHVFAGCLLAALPFWAILHLIAGLRSGTAWLALAIAAIAIAIGHALLHAARHARGERPYAGGRYVSPQAQWRMARSAFRAWKRAIDLCVAVPALLIFAPIMLAAAACIVLESGRPILFRQTRVGRGGTYFSILKFRTMDHGSGSAWARPGDTRITRSGAWLRRTSLDELPQLVNVIRGEMSLVGPRPEMVRFAHDFSRTIPHYDERHVVAPGITGWAQIQLQRNLSPTDVPAVLPYDLFYVEHASPVLDLIVLAKTAAEFLFQHAV